MTTPFPFTQGQVLTAAQMNAITTLPINDQTASYVALVGDVGKRIVMNVASANTVTFNNSVFATGDTIFIANKGAGATTVTAGAGVTINTAGSLVIAQHGGGTLVATSASVFTFFPSGGIGYGVATGGTSSSITVSDVNYTLLTFTGDGTLTVTKSGLFDVLVFGGGGGGSSSQSDQNRPAGGGGAGARTISTVYLDANAAITIGGGGAGGTSQGFGTQGGASIVGSKLAVIGGGSGQSPFNVTASSVNAIRGGCGGGGAGNTNFTDGALSSYANTDYGRAGGNGVNESSGGGGGGAGAVEQRCLNYWRCWRRRNRSKYFHRRLITIEGWWRWWWRCYWWRRRFICWRCRR